MQEDSFDVVIIGGGINAVAAARDCAMRRLSVALFERGNLGAESSTRHSGLVQCGLSLLETPPEFARQVIEELVVLERIAPNLVRRVPMLIPALKGDSSVDLEKLEALTEVRGGMLTNRLVKAPIRLTAEDVAALGAGFSADIRGALCLEDWVVDTHPLVLLNARSAADAGTQIFTHYDVEQIVVEEGAAVGVQVLSDEGERAFVGARVVLNLTGARAHSVLPAGARLPRFALEKGVFLEIDGSLSPFGLLCRGAGVKRNVFLVPVGSKSILFTVGDRFFAHPDQGEVSQDEVAFLVDSLEPYCPSLKDARISRAYCGIRPLPSSKSDRGEWHHRIFDHTNEGADGLLTLLGGTFATARLSAEELTDAVCRRLKHKEPCRTHLESLRGTTGEIPWKEESRRLGLDPHLVKGILTRRGRTGAEILENAMGSPERQRLACECAGVVQAEIEMARADEWGDSLEALSHRTTFGTGTCGGSRCAKREALALGLPLLEACEFLERRWAERRPALTGDTLAQQEYDEALHFLSEGGK